MISHPRRNACAALALVAALACRLPGQRSVALALPRVSASEAAARAIDVRALDETVARVLRAALADSAFPGAIAIVGTHSGILSEVAVGQLDWSVSPATDAATVWDLASLTKVIALTTAIMQLAADGRIDIDAPVQRYLPEWTGANKELVTVRQLLTHSSGLPSWRPLYKEALSAESAIRLVYATSLDTIPGAKMVYSDLGAILMGQIVERVSGASFETFVSRQVFRPLGMRETFFRPPASLVARIAPTEIDPWRQRHLRGEVHDENAFALGGVSSHAGLFSTAADLSRFARMYLGNGALDGVRVLDSATIARFTTLQDARISSRALGWEKPSGTNSAGHGMSDRAFGHTGFTGTSLWIDPANDVFVLLLTNRVNPTRTNVRIGRVRVAIADSVMGQIRRCPGANVLECPRGQS